MFATIWRHRQLIGRLTARELAQRYRGSMLGALWSVITPLLMLGVYTFVFRTVFQARWGVNGDHPGEFALFLFAGLTLYTIFSECAARAPSLMLENTAYIKKVVFPLEIMPVVILLGALVNAAISLGILLAFHLVLLGLPPTTALLAPLALLPPALLTLGVSWFLASAGMFLRDIRQFIGILITMLMFLSPVFYPASAVPERLSWLMALNPLTPMLEIWRGLLFDGRLPDLASAGLSLIMGLFPAWIGYVWFVKTRKGFADVV